jgi:phospholipid transport system transporter-binding protein
MYQPQSDLTLASLNTALPAGLQAILQGQTDFDLSATGTVDSVAVAMMLGWQRAAQARGQVLRFRSVPANLQSLVHLYGVAELFELK